MTTVSPLDPLRVIARPALRNRSLNAYNALIYEAMRDQGVKVTEYHGGRWLTQHHHVFHVHWPESVFNHGLRGAQVVTQLLLRAMDWLRLRGTRCVWTVHNLAAHERRYPREERSFLDAFVRRLDGFIVLHASALDLVRSQFPVLADKPGFVVAHPHYRGAYPASVTRAAARQRLGLPASSKVVTFVGQILEYKNVVQLVDVFRSMTEACDQGLRLVVAGKPRTAALAQQIQNAAGGDRRVLLALAYLPSAELQNYLSAADLVALPYREILNSGSAVLALSFDRAVLMPVGPAAEALQARVGTDWLHAYEQLTPAVIREALCVSRPARCDGPWLEDCAPSAIATQTIAAYRALLADR